MNIQFTSGKQGSKLLKCSRPTYRGVIIGIYDFRHVQKCKKINFVLLLIECIFSLYMTTIMMYGAYNYIVLVL